MTNTAVTWEEYCEFMKRYYQTQFIDRGDSAKFFREQAKVMGRAVPTLRSFVNGCHKPEWRKRFVAEYKPQKKTIQVQVDRTPPAKRQIDGVIINHPLAMKSWV